MSKKLFVGNLSFQTTESEITSAFETYGPVESVSIITDKYDGRPRGFAFIEMPSAAEAQEAITRLNGKVIKERTLTVSSAKPRSDDRSGGYRSGTGKERTGGTDRR